MPSTELAAVRVRSKSELARLLDDMGWTSVRWDEALADGAYLRISMERETVTDADPVSLRERIKRGGEVRYALVLAGGHVLYMGCSLYRRADGGISVSLPGQRRPRPLEDILGWVGRAPQPGEGRSLRGARRHALSVQGVPEKGNGR